MKRRTADVVIVDLIARILYFDNTLNIVITWMFTAIDKIWLHHRLRYKKYEVLSKIKEKKIAWQLNYSCSSEWHQTHEILIDWTTLFSYFCTYLNAIKLDRRRICGIRSRSVVLRFNEVLRSISRSYIFSYEERRNEFSVRDDNIRTETQMIFF